MRASQLDVNLLCNTNCNLSNSISLARQTEGRRDDTHGSHCDHQAALYIDQLVDINGRLIQIGCDVKRRLIRQWHCLNAAITAEADDMIKIDSDPIKIDDVIGRITEMDGPDNQFVTLEWLSDFARSPSACSATLSASVYLFICL